MENIEFLTTRARKNFIRKYLRWLLFSRTCSLARVKYFFIFSPFFSPRDVETFAIRTSATSAPRKSCARDRVYTPRRHNYILSSYQPYKIYNRPFFLLFFSLSLSLRHTHLRPLKHTLLLLLLLLSEFRFLMGSPCLFPTLGNIQCGGKERTNISIYHNATSINVFR